MIVLQQLDGDRGKKQQGVMMIVEQQWRLDSNGEEEPHCGVVCYNTYFDYVGKYLLFSTLMMLGYFLLKKSYGLGNHLSRYLCKRRIIILSMESKILCCYDE